MKKPQKLPQKHTNSVLEQKIKTLKQHLPDLKKQYSVSSLGIFGSYVQGRQKSRSDLDILVDFDFAPSFFGFLRLERYLSGILGVKVDLVMKSALRPNIGKHILREVISV